MKIEIKKGESFKDKSKELQLKNNNKDDIVNKFLIVFNEQTKDFRIEKVKDNDFNLEEELSQSFQNISDDEDTHNINNQSTSNTSSNDQATNSSQKLDKRPLSLNDFIKSNSNSNNDNDDESNDEDNDNDVVSSSDERFMSWKPPAYVRESLTHSIDNDTSVHHYSHPKGRPRLRQALSNHYSQYFSCLNGRKLDTEFEIIVTAGANEGIYSILRAYLDSGDEVILFEPAFDQYMPNVRYNGGKEVYVPIRFHGDSSRNSTGDDWKIDINELKAAITSKTKAIIFNTPHNPIGKVFNERELNEIAQVAIENNLLVISDEVYDCLTFDNSNHLRIANIPGMWERTLTVGSAGKSFAATGWRVGWVIGHEELIKATLAATVRIVFCVNSTAQEGAAVGLERAKEQNFFETQKKEYEERRNVLTKHLDHIGLPYTNPSGSYFILADISKVDFPEDYPFPDYIKSRTRDYRFAWWLAHEFDVVTIPPSDFYGDQNQKLGEQFIRFAFCKEVEILDEAGKRLHKLKNFIKK